MITPWAVRSILKSRFSRQNSKNASSDNSGTESRWGDYSTTTVDAADPTSFWTIQMYPAAASTWNM